MSDSQTEYSIGLPEQFRRQAAELYDEAFGPKFALAVPDRARRVALLAASMVPRFAIAAIRDGQLVGIAGFHTSEGSLTSGIGLRGLLSKLGLLGGLRAAAVFSLYERTPAEDELLMDGIAVRGDQRGLGIGTALLDQVARYAESHGFCTVRLEVIDTNPAARRLYERQGFVAARVERFEYLRWLLGFGGSTTMERTVSAPPAPRKMAAT